MVRALLDQSKAPMGTLRVLVHSFHKNIGTYLIPQAQQWNLDKCRKIQLNCIQLNAADRKLMQVEELSKKKIPNTYNIFFYNTSFTSVIKEEGPA